MKTESIRCFHFLYQMINRQKQICRKLYLNMRKTLLCRWSSTGTDESPSLEVSKNPLDIVLCAVCSGMALLEKRMGQMTHCGPFLTHSVILWSKVNVNSLNSWPKPNMFWKKNFFGRSQQLSVTYWIIKAKPPHCKTNKWHYSHKVFQVPDCCCTIAVQNFKQT